MFKIMGGMFKKSLQSLKTDGHFDILVSLLQLYRRKSKDIQEQVQ